MYRIIGADGKEYGPISADQARQWIAEGRIVASTHALVQGTSVWKPIASLPEFSLLFAAREYPAAPTPYAVPPSRQSTGLAITGLILGIISLTFGICCCYGLPFNVTGLIISIIALTQIKSDPERYGGKSIAIVGLILCALSFALMAFIIIFAALSAGFGQMSHHVYRL
jgi:hypothetical protein